MRIDVCQYTKVKSTALTKCYFLDLLAVKFIPTTCISVIDSRELHVGEDSSPRRNLPNLHRAVTYPRSRDPRSARKTDQLAFEVAGRKAGNVPASLCGLFRMLRRS